MDLHTEINIIPSQESIKLKDRLFTIGSCFSQVMGVALRQNKFDVTVNPFGTVYNPHSIYKLLHKAIDRETADDNSYIKSGEVWYHYDFHSDLSELDKDKLVKNIGRRIDQSHQSISKVNWVMITFGTSFVYRLLETEEIVANCHKVPQQYFEKHALSLDEIISGFDEVYAKLKGINPNVKVILTVSPVRHTKDGLSQNAYSKSLLRIACEQIVNSYSGVHYFPSYEIMIDDLRDYRYYGHDLIHPNEIAEDYIWRKFVETFINEEDQKVLEKWQKVRKALDHRPRHPETIEYKLFLKNTLKDLEQLGALIDLKGEIAQVKSILKA